VRRHDGYDDVDSLSAVTGARVRLVGATAAALDATDAVEPAASALGLDDPAGLRVTPSKAQERLVSGGGISATLGWQAAACGWRGGWRSTRRRSRDAGRRRSTRAPARRWRPAIS
jgi:hypothetical protein